MSENQSLTQKVEYKLINDTNKKRRQSSIGILFDWRGWFTSRECDEKYEKLHDDNDKTKAESAVGYLQLFRCADQLDIIMIAIALCLAILNGAAYTARFIVFGELISSFAEEKFIGRCPPEQNVSITFNITTECQRTIEINATNHNLSQTSCLYENSSVVPTQPIFTPGFLDGANQNLYWLLLISAVELFCIGFRYFLLAWSAGRQTARIRIRLLQSLMRRARYCLLLHVSNIDNLSKGIGFESSMLIMTVFATIFSAIYALIVNWQLSLVILATVPFTMVGAYGFSKLTAIETKKQLDVYAQAGAVVQEVFSSLRTVLSLNGEKFEEKRYVSKLRATRWNSIRKGAAFGLLAGWVYLIGYVIYSIGFAFGSYLMNRGEYDSIPFHDIIVIIVVLVRPITNVAFVSPFFQLLEEARGAVAPVFQLIDEDENMDLNEIQTFQDSTTSEVALNIEGDIQFDNINFAYPARPNVPVLNNLTLTARVGETTALVGSNGSGKSTVVSLLLRFYEPTSGSIKIRDQSIADCNLKQLRKKIGVVSQEPILFATTIYENIRFGRENATRVEIVDAAQQANAHDFIMQLPNKYETIVGERGVQLSGGEKQRVALARALVKQPVIVVLDEATSALDNKNEKIVQEALDRTCKGRTTIVIAHRLAAVKNAHRIYVLDKGSVIEQGTHETLMAQEGSHYRELMRVQHTEDDIDETSDPTHMDEDAKQPLERSRYYSYYEIDDKDQMTTSRRPVFIRLLSMNRPEWVIILVGCLACLFGGLCQLVQVFLLTDSLNAFGECTYQKRTHTINKYSLLLILTGIFNLIFRFIQYTALATSGSKLTERICAKAFTHFLSQEMAFFDRPENSSGAICNRLSSDALAVQHMAGTRLGIICESLATFGIGIFVGYFYSWELTTVLLLFVLIFFGLALFQINWQSRLNQRSDQILGLASSLAVEIIHNMRIVKQLANEKEFLHRFSDFITKEFKARRNDIIISSFIYSVYWGTAPLILMFAYSIFGLESLRCIMTLTRQMSESLTAARSFFNLLDRIPTIDNRSTDCKQLADLQGEISFEQVKFAYVSRPKKCVLNKFQLTIKPGQRVALIGSSGSGKSTVIQLLERFYEPIKGHVSLDGVDIRQLNIQWLRSRLGLVSQEPVLFNLTVAENIAYGLENILIEDIIDAATKANIHHFIEQLPQGYDTKVGMKGSHLSGGEKQRIAIARVLLRRPKILLLDEATSAMDAHNEQIVQDALEKAQTDDPTRTSLIIAHRLSTIRSCDVICVLDHGIVVESGNHTDLMERRGFYYNMLVHNST
ncbi:unnamed protein product [Rotaria socialis]|uniref:Uncharacterized protein n=1 Tax=Rotaria socialis TaxID=392032 RepID=A0A820SXV6_9BILA|nr:unnamed protein product [Rotaria socialis]CAF4460085.1 unnamed protein product [Rotaria socialis]